MYLVLVTSRPPDAGRPVYHFPGGVRVTVDHFGSRLCRLAAAGSRVVGDTATERGGGLYLLANATLTNSLIADSQAGIAGSGLYALDSSPPPRHRVKAA